MKYWRMRKSVESRATREAGALPLAGCPARLRLRRVLSAALILMLLMNGTPLTWEAGSRGRAEDDELIVVADDAEGEPEQDVAEVDEGELHEGLPPEEPEDAESDAPAEDEADAPRLRYRLGGEAASLSELLAALKLSIELDEVKSVGLTDADQAGLLRVTRAGEDYTLEALADFDSLDLAIETASGLYTVELTDGIAPEGEEAADQADIQDTEDAPEAQTEEISEQKAEEIAEEEAPSEEETEETETEETTEPETETIETEEPVEETEPEIETDSTVEPETEATVAPTLEPEVEEIPEPEITSTPEIEATPEPETTPEETREPEITSTPEIEETPEPETTSEVTPALTAEPIPEPTAEPTPTAEPRPEQRFEARAAGVSVSVTAPEGAFPEGVAMRVRPVYSRDTLDDIESAVSEDFIEVKRVHAVDISFWLEGEELEPALPIAVVMSLSAIPETQEAVVVHVDDDGNAAVVAETQAEAAQVAFEADSFSVYALVITEQLETRYIDASGDAYLISLGYGPEAGIPAGATLQVREADADAYLAEAAEALPEGKAVGLARFFDIKIMADGQPVQPLAPVEVRVTLEEKGEGDVAAVHFAEDGAQLINAQQSGEAVVFSAESFSVYGIVYTVDFSYSVDGQVYDFSLSGGGAIALSTLVEALGVNRDTEFATGAEFVAQVDRVAFSDASLMWVGKVEETRTVAALKAENGLTVRHSRELTDAQIDAIDAQTIAAGDWALISLRPFGTEETLTIAMKNGDVFEILVTDAQYVDDLSNVFKSLAILKNGEECDLDAPIIVRDSDTFVIKLAFEEHDEYQFMNDDTKMFFKMPTDFVLPEDFETTTDVSITVGGKVHVLKNNVVTYDPVSHKVYLQWNTTDPEFAYLKKSGDANIELSVTGTFTADETKKVEFSDSVTVTIAPPANAGVEKKGTYDEKTHTITYTLSVTAEGDVTGDITLTDQFIGGKDSALSYVENSVSVSWNKDSARTVADNTSIINSWKIAEDGSSFTITIPKDDSNNKISLKDKEVCVISYQAAVDMTKLNLSTDTAYDSEGNPIEQVFDDTGNLVVLSNPDNRYDEPGDNESTHVQPIQFSDMEKTSELGPATNGTDAQGNDIRYRDITWTVVTNKSAEASLAGSTITDTMTWNPDFITMQLQPLTGDDAGILVKVYDQESGNTGEPKKLIREEYIPWTALHVKRGSDKEADGTSLSTLTWTYDIPEGDTPGYKYEITYIARANLADVKVGSTVFNEVYGKGGRDDAQETIWPGGYGDNISVDKRVNSSSLDNIVWDIDILACTTEYTDYFRVTDTIPSQWVNNPESEKGERLKDTIEGLEYNIVYAQDDPKIAGKITVTGLQEGETWTAELVNGGSGASDKLLIRFYKTNDSGEQVEGLKAYTGTDKVQVTVTEENGETRQSDRRKIHIGLTTKNNGTWVEWATRNMATKSWQAYHQNKVQVRGDTGHYDFDEASAPIVKPTIVKSLSYPVNQATQYTTVLKRNEGKKDGIEYPAYRFVVSAGGIRSDNDTIHKDENGKYILIEDTFDTGKWMLLESKDFSTGWYSWMDIRAFRATQPGYPSDSNGAVEIAGESFVWTETDNGIELRLYNPPTKEDGSYYNFYTFMYWLIPRDKEAMKAVIADTLNPDNKQVLAHVTKGVAEYENTAALVLTKGDPLTDKAEYEYEYNPTSKTVSFDEVNRIASYTVVLNGQKADLVPEGEEQVLEMTDEHSANLSIDYSSIKIYINEETTPDTENRVTYDYSGNIGTFKIPDETKVTITYDARLIATSGKTVNFENTVTMNGYKTTVTESRKIVSDSVSGAGVYQLELFKYGNGNMQSGLAGATFRLLDANKKPILDRDGREITFVTEGDGYATITLDEHEQGVSLKRNTTYYLQELKAPVVVNEQTEGGSTVTYYRQDPTYYSFLISDNPNYSAPGGVYVYTNGDILKVRNFEDKGGLNISKSFAGNVKLTDEQKQQLTFRVEKKTSSGGWSLVREVPYTEFTYSDYVDENGKKITGTYHYAMEGLAVGEVYRVTERNANLDDEDVTLATEYLVDGSASDSRQFTIVASDVAQENKSSHNVVITNTYYKSSYTFTKLDAESGAALEGAEFGVFRDADAEPRTALKTYTTGEDGTFEITQKDEGADYEQGVLYYAVETAAPAGYVLPETPEKFYFYFGGELELPSYAANAVNLVEDYGTATVTNEKQLVDVPVMKNWGKNEDMNWLPTVQYIKLGLYQREAGSTAEPEPVLKDEEPVIATLTPEDAIEGLTNQYGSLEAFTGLPAASEEGKLLEYSVKEIAVSFDGETDVDPEDSFTVTYSDKTIGEGASAVVYKAVNNTDRGTTLSVTKEWYLVDGATHTKLEQPVGSEYARSFKLYRTTEEQIYTNNMATLPVDKAPSSKTDPDTKEVTYYCDFELDGLNTVHPGETISVTINAYEYMTFEVQYSKMNWSWAAIEDNPNQKMKPGDVQTFTVVVPSEDIRALKLCCWSGSSTNYISNACKMTVAKAKSGSTEYADISEQDINALTNLVDLVSEFSLPANDGSWKWESELLDKYNDEGEEYYYWVHEVGANDRTSYEYKDGKVTISNYKDIINVKISKEWYNEDGEKITDLDELKQMPPVLFDLYRTTATFNGTSEQERCAIVQREHIKSAPDYIECEPGDELKFRITVGPVPEEIIYEKYTENDDDVKKGTKNVGDYKYQTYVEAYEKSGKTKKWFTYQFNMFNKNAWSGAIFTSAKYWVSPTTSDSDTMTFEVTYTLKDGDMPVDNTGNNPKGFYLRDWHYDEAVEIEVIHNNVGFAQTQLEKYATDEEAECVKRAIELNKDHWSYSTDDDGMVLSVYDNSGRKYQYFAVEHQVPGYNVEYVIKTAETVAKNKKKEETIEKGSLQVSKQASGLPQGLDNKEFSFTVSKDGYYFDINGKFGTNSNAFLHKVKNREKIIFNDLPVGVYTIEEVIKGSQGAEIPNYRLSTTLIVDNCGPYENTINILNGSSSYATIVNTYEKGVDQTTLKVKKVWDPAPVGETSATFTLKRYMNDGITPDEIAWNEALYIATLDGETDAREQTAWEYTWPEVDKVYWDYDKGEYVDYVYRIEETSVTYNGVTTDLTDGGSDLWKVQTTETADGWAVTNTRNSVTLTLNKLWQSPTGATRQWPKNGDAYVPVTVTVSKSLNIPGVGLKPSTEKVTLRLVPDNDQLKTLNASAGCTITAEAGDSYAFTIDGLKETGEMTISGTTVSGTWVYSFAETQLQGFEAPGYGDGGSIDATLASAASGQTIVNKQQPTTAALKVTKAVTLADGATPYDTWPKDGFTFTLAQSSTQAGVVMPGNASATARDTKTAKFEEITFNAAGEYSFTITERDGGVANYTYDTAAHTVAVKVVEKDGKLSVESVKYDGEDALTVTNKYAEPDEVLFRVKKTFAGGKFPNSEPFTFKLTQVADDQSETQIGSASTITTEGRYGSVAVLTFDPVTLGAGKYWFMLEEAKGDNADIQYDATKHWVKVEVSTDGATTVIKKNGEPYDPAAVDAEFTNTLSISQTATKRWVEADGTTPFIPESGTTITLQLTQWKKDGTQVEDFKVEPVTLDGAKDDSAVTLKESSEAGAGKTIYTGQEGGNWSYTWNNLPKVYRDPNNPGAYLEYEYQVLETRVGDSSVGDGITADGKYLVSVDGLEVVNRKNEKSAEFGKQWRDDGGLPMDWLTNGETPVPITVTLKREGDETYQKSLTLDPNVSSVTFDDDTSHAVTWKLPQAGDARKLYWFSIDGLPKYKADGTQWEYYVVEEALTVGSKTYLTSYSAQADKAGEREYIVNRDPTTSLKVSKVWYDLEGKRVKVWPEGKVLTLHLYRTGVSESVWTMNGVEPDWSESKTIDGQTVLASFTNADGFVLELSGLPAADATGKAYEYYVTEDRVPGYAPAVYGNSGEYNGRTDGAYHKGVIENTQPTTQLTFTKLWRLEDGSGYTAWPKQDKAEIPIIVAVKGSNDATYTATLNSAGEVEPTEGSSVQWSASKDGNATAFTVTGLPLWGDGDAELTYTVRETSCEGYRASYAVRQESQNEETGETEVAYVDKTGAGSGSAVDGEYIVNTPSTTPSTASLTVSKTVTGNMADTEQAFEFTLVTDGQESERYTLTREGEEPKEIASGDKFSLAHGQSVTISGIPSGETVTISEANGAYTTTWKLDDAEQEPTNGTSQVRFVLEDNSTLAVTNSLEALVDTGVTLDAIPYVALLLLLGALLITTRRRRRREE